MYKQYLDRRMSCALGECMKLPELMMWDTLVMEERDL
jgi:hypothetical protein